MKALTVINFFLFLSGVLLFLGQLWFHLFTPELFAKIMITVGALFAVSIALNFIIKENRQTDKIHQGGKLDE